MDGLLYLPSSMLPLCYQVSPQSAESKSQCPGLSCQHSFALLLVKRPHVGLTLPLDEPCCSTAAWG